MATTATVEQLAQVQEILAQLDRQPNPDQANRRQKDRVNVRMSLSMIVLSDNSRPTLHIFTRNISTAGIGFVGRRPFKSGEFLAFEFHVPNHSSKFVLTQVTFCRYVKAGLYEVGAKFLEAATVNSALLHPYPPHWNQMADPRIVPPEAATKPASVPAKNKAEKANLAPVAAEAPAAAAAVAAGK